MTPSAEIRAFFDKPTSTVTYLVFDPATREAAVIDPVLDYDPASGEVDTGSVAAVLAEAERLQLKVGWALETHVHADHLSGAPYIKAKTGAKVGIGQHIADVQRIFRPIFNASDLVADGRDFDRLFKDGDRLRLGELEVEVIYTPGHTRRRVRRRYAVHAGLRYGACRLPRRRCAPTLSVDPQAPRLARRNPAVHVP